MKVGCPWACCGTRSTVSGTDQARSCSNCPALAATAVDGERARAAATYGTATTAPKEDNGGRHSQHRDATSVAPRADLEVAQAIVVSRSLHVVADLGVADHVGDAPVSAEHLAAACGVDADALGRVLRLLVVRR